MRFGCALVASVLLQACSSSPELVSTLAADPATRQGGGYVGAGTQALVDDQVAAAVAYTLKSLESLQQDAMDLSLRVERLSGPMIRLRMDSGRSFDGGSAQLRPQALAGHLAIAERLRGLESMVVHVVVLGDAAGDVVSSGLPARRAASLYEYLRRRGVAPARLRAEGRDVPGSGEHVEIFLKPVIRGREADAWSPPTG